MQDNYQVELCLQHNRVKFDCPDCIDQQKKYKEFVTNKLQFLITKQNNMREEFKKKQKKIREIAEKVQIIQEKVLKQIEDDKEKFEIETQQLIDNFRESKQLQNQLNDYKLYQENQNFGNDDSSMKIFLNHQKKIQQSVEKFEKLLDEYKNPKEIILPAINMSGKITIEKQAYYIPIEDDPKYYKFTVNKDGTYMANFDLKNIQIRKYQDLQYKNFKELDVGTSVNCLKFGTDDTLYVAEDGEIVVWKFENDNWEKKVGFNAHNGSTINEIIIDSKETIYSCGDDKSVEVRQKEADNWRKKDNLKIQLDYLPRTIKINTSENLLAVIGFSQVSVFQKTQEKWETVKQFKEKNILNFEFLRDNLACMQFQDQIRFYTIQGNIFTDNLSIIIQIKNIDLKKPFIWSQGYFIMNQTDNKCSVAGLVNDSLSVKAQLDGQLEYFQISQNKKTMISLNYKDRQFQFYKII